MHSENDSALES